MSNRQIIFKPVQLTVLLLGFCLSLLIFIKPLYALPAEISYVGGSTPFICTADRQADPSDLFQDFKQLMPGDKIQSDIILRNDSRTADSVKLYLNAVAVTHESELSPYTLQKTADIQAINEFLRQLEMKVWLQNHSDGNTSGRRLIYYAAPDQTAQLTSAIPLATLARNEQAVLTVELSAPITMENAYAGRIGEVHWLLAAEEYATNIGSSNEPDTSHHNNGSLLPRTGQNTDHNDIRILVAITLSIIGVLLLSYIYRRKYSN